MSDLRTKKVADEVMGHTTVGAHLTKSHLCAHTYPDWYDPRRSAASEVDIDIATCGTIVPLRALNFMFESFENDVVIIDYVVRGFTRDAEGRRVYMDHTLKSIQDFIDPKILADYHCEDLVLQNENIWQTKMMRTRLDPSAYFPPDVDPAAPEASPASATCGARWSRSSTAGPAEARATVESSSTVDPAGSRSVGLRVSRVAGDDQERRADERAGRRMRIPEEDVDAEAQRDRGVPDHGDARGGREAVGAGHPTAGRRCRTSRCCR